MVASELLMVSRPTKSAPKVEGTFLLAAAHKVGGPWRWRGRTGLGRDGVPL